MESSRWISKLGLVQGSPAEMCIRDSIRYQKLEKNELIPGNTNKGFEMATGEYIALLDHDDLLHPCALWYAARAIAEQKADFVYTDEATFEGKPEHVVLYHFKDVYKRQRWCSPPPAHGHRNPHR